MSTRHWWAALALLTCLSDVFGAQDVAEKFARIHQAIGAAFPEKQFWVWEGTEGDIDRDGIRDYAAVVVLEEKDGGRENRVVVFSGMSDGKYKSLSVSGRFCEARKFYGLTIGVNTLFVQVFSHADSAGSESSTLQFRYNEKLADFELVGREDRSTNYDENSSHKVSINYLTGVAIQARHLGTNYIERRYTADGTEEIVQHSRRSSKHKEVKTKFNSTVLFRLQGFDCPRYLDEDPAAILPIHIDEDFKVQRE